MLNEIMKAVIPNKPYKALAYVSIVIVVLALSQHLPGIANFHALVFGMGLLLLSIGWWTYDISPQPKITGKKIKGANESTGKLDLNPIFAWSLMIGGLLLLILAIYFMINNHGPI